MLQGLGIVFMDLIGNKIAPATRVNLPSLFKIGTGQAGGQLLKKIILDKPGAMGFGDEPALGRGLTMHRTEHFGTG